MLEEEARAHESLERASAITASYGIRVSTSCVRARDPGAAILEQAALDKCEIIIIGAPRKRPATRGTSVFGTTVEDVLKRASCRVMVIGAAPIEAYAVNTAA
jgi:nucleotide-binding universal stress UspA family protein